MSRPLQWGLALVVLVLVSLGAFWTYRAHRLEAQLRAERIASANLLAAKDTTIVAVKRDGDRAVTVARRLAFQERVELAAYFTDSISRLTDSLEVVGKVLARFAILGDSVTVLQEALARLDALGNIVTADTVDLADSLGVRAAAVVSIPRIVVTLPQGETSSASWTWHVERLPMSLELALHCEGSFAVAQLAGPPWAGLELARVAQDETICNPLPRRSWNPFAVELPSLPFAALLVGGGILVGRGF